MGKKSKNNRENPPPNSSPVKGEDQVYKEEIIKDDKFA